jgi:cytidylate kinase
MKDERMLDDAFLKRVKADAHTYGYPFATISRQAGAGGHTLAEALLARIEATGGGDLYRGWRIFDDEICTALIRDPELHVSLNELLTESYNGPVRDFFHEIVGKQTSHYTVAKRVFDFVRTVAQFGKVIIVGRAGACVTGGLPGGVHARLVASAASRESRMAQRFQVTLREARAMMEKQDGDRARLVQDFFDHDIADPALYDHVWDSDEMAIEEMADQLLEDIRARAVEVGRS